MRHISNAIKIDDCVTERIKSIVLEKVLSFKAYETGICNLFDIFCQDKDCALFRDINRADCTGPIINIFKKISVDRFIMFKIKRAFNGGMIQLSGFRKRNGGFNPGKFRVVVDIKLINKAGCAIIAVSGQRIQIVSD